MEIESLAPELTRTKMEVQWREATTSWQQIIADVVQGRVSGENKCIKQDN